MTPVTVIEGKLLAVLAFAGVALVLAAYSVRASRFGPDHELAPRYRAWHRAPGTISDRSFHWAARAVGRAISRTRVSPDALTLASLALTAPTMPLAATGHFARLPARFSFSGRRSMP